METSANTRAVGSCRIAPTCIVQFVPEPIDQFRGEAAGMIPVLAREAIGIEVRDISPCRQVDVRIVGMDVERTCRRDEAVLRV